MVLVYIYLFGKYYERFIGKKSLLNIIVYLCVYIYVCIFVLLNIGRDIGLICIRMLLIRSYLIVY